MEIDVNDYLDEVSTKNLRKELKKRMEPENLDSDWDKLSAIGRVKLILNLKPYATKAEIINEINEL